MQKTPYLCGFPDIFKKFSKDELHLIFCIIFIKIVILLLNFGVFCLFFAAFEKNKISFISIFIFID